VIAVSVVVVAVVSSLTLAVLLTLIAYLFVGLVTSTKRRLGGTVSSRWLTWVGVAISALGVVGLIWTQVQSPFGGGLGLNEGYRWQIAMGPLSVIGLGALLSVAAQVMGLLQSAERRSVN
jgi:hypothetical protein